MKFFKRLILVTLLGLSHLTFAASVEKIGVLILAHGGDPSWNQMVLDATQSIGEKYPVEVAFGMALPRTLQEGIDKLESQGVNKIVVVPLFISSHSFIIRQTEYLLGLRDELADPPLVMDHGTGGHHGSHHANGHHEMTHGSGHGQQHEPNSDPLPQLRISSEIIMTRALDDHAIVADILYRRIMDMSVNPAQEIVIIVGHGPNSEQDNACWVEAMTHLADRVRQLQKDKGSDFRFVYALTVRDDADPAIYNQAKEQLRSLVSQAGKQGDVLVVPLLLSKGGVEQGIVRRLEGLNYKWTGDVLLPDEGIVKFIEGSVEEAVVRS